MNKFNTTKYTKHYHKLIQKAVLRGIDKETGYEVHHIVPRSMGGTNTHDNLIKLTFREHYIAHLLLTKMCISERDQIRTLSAYILMGGRSIQNGIRFNARLFEAARTNQLLKGKYIAVNDGNGNYARHYYSDGQIPEGWAKGGRPKSDEHKARIAAGHLGGTKDQSKSRGKSWWHNPVTGDMTQVLKDQEPPEGYVKGLPSTKKANHGYVRYYNQVTGEYKSFKCDEDVDSDWIRRGKPKPKESTMRGAATRKKLFDEGKITGVTGYKWHHNPTTGKSIRLSPTDTIPDGYVIGASESHKEQIAINRLGKKQTDHQKKTVSEALANNYEIRYDTGEVCRYEKMSLTNLSQFLGYGKNILKNIFYGNSTGQRQGIVSIKTF